MNQLRDYAKEASLLANRLNVLNQQSTAYGRQYEGEQNTLQEEQSLQKKLDRKKIRDRKEKIKNRKEKMQNIWQGTKDVGKNIWNKNKGRSILDSSSNKNIKEAAFPVGKTQLQTQGIDRYAKALRQRITAFLSNIGEDASHLAYISNQMQDPKMQSIARNAYQFINKFVPQFNSYANAMGDNEALDTGANAFVNLLQNFSTGLNSIIDGQPAQVSDTTQSIEPIEQEVSTEEQVGELEVQPRGEELQPKKEEVGKSIIPSNIDDMVEGINGLNNTEDINKLWGALVRRRNYLRSNPGI